MTRPPAHALGSRAGARGAASSSPSARFALRFPRATEPPLDRERSPGSTRSTRSPPIRGASSSASIARSPSRPLTTSSPETPGIAELRRAGYRVIVWESRSGDGWTRDVARARALESRAYVVVLDRSANRAFAVDPDGAVAVRNLRRISHRRLRPRPAQDDADRCRAGNRRCSRPSIAWPRSSRVTKRLVEPSYLRDLASVEDPWTSVAPAALGALPLLGLSAADSARPALAAGTIPLADAPYLPGSHIPISVSDFAALRRRRARTGDAGRGRSLAAAANLSRRCNDRSGQRQRAGHANVPARRAAAARRGADRGRRLRQRRRVSPRRYVFEPRHFGDRGRSERRRFRRRRNALRNRHRRRRADAGIAGAVERPRGSVGASRRRDRRRSANAGRPDDQPRRRRERRAHARRPRRQRLARRDGSDRRRLGRRFDPRPNLRCGRQRRVGRHRPHQHDARDRQDSHGRARFFARAFRRRQPAIRGLEPKPGFAVRRGRTRRRDRTRPAKPHAVADSAALEFPLGVALDDRRARVYVTDEAAHRVYVLDAATLAQVRAPLSTCQVPWKPTFDPIGDRLYVPCARSNRVDVFDGRTLSRVPGAPFRTAEYPLAVAVSPTAA